jgi:hypothetical protein
MTVKAIEAYEILKEIGLKEDKAEKIVDFVQEAAESKIEQEIKGLVTNETFVKETSKIREDMANMKADIIKWNVGTIIAVASIVAAIVKFIK